MDTDNVNIRKISRFFTSLSPEEMDQLFYKKDKHMEYVADLDVDGYCLHWKDMWI